MHLWEVDGGRRIYWKNVMNTHTDTHAGTQTDPPTKTDQNARQDAPPNTHTHTQIHRAVLLRWMASLIMVEIKKWITGVHPLFRQLWPKTPPRSESYWSLEMNNQHGKRGRVAHRGHVHLNRSSSRPSCAAQLEILKERTKCFIFWTQVFFPPARTPVVLFRATLLSEPVLMLKRNLSHWELKKT